MTFTVVRAVRGAESSATDPVDKPQRLSKTAAPPIASSRMDLPRIDEVLELDFADLDFPETIPGDLAR